MRDDEMCRLGALTELGRIQPPFPAPATCHPGVQNWLRPYATFDRSGSSLKGIILNRIELNHSLTYAEDFLIKFVDCLC